jgi:cobalt ECF transporter T component CbiQ
VAADIPGFLLKKSVEPPLRAEARPVTDSHLDKGISGLAGIIRQTFLEWELDPRNGFLQALDPRIKILFWMALLVVVSLKSQAQGLAAVAVAAALLGLFSKVRLAGLFARVIPLSFFFGFLVSAPAALNVITPGTMAIPVLELPRPYSFWVYNIPREIGITQEGIRVCSTLTLRVFDSLFISFLMMTTTPFHEIVRALKLFRVPDAVLLIISLTYKYIYIFAQTVSDMHRAMKARLALGLSASDFRLWSAGRMVTVFRKTGQNVEDIYRAMLSRGFSGEIRLPGAPVLKRGDIVGLGALAFFVLAAYLV